MLKKLLLFLVPFALFAEKQSDYYTITDIPVPDGFEVTCDPDRFSDVSDALDQASITCQSKQVTRIPGNTVELENVDAAKQVLKLMEALDDHDDVQSVSANFDIPDDAMAALQ